MVGTNVEMQFLKNEKIKRNQRKDITWQSFSFSVDG